MMINTKDIRFLPSGECGMVVELGSIIDAGLNRMVHILTQNILDRTDIPVKEIIPTYRSLLIFFNPLEISRNELKSSILDLLRSMPEVERTIVHRKVNIPVLYGGSFGPDLDFVAGFNKISPEEVVKIHSETIYRVYMLGFMPGFPYLGGLSSMINAPRLESPRKKIPAGSVGIAGSQTGIYSLESPGGWRIIGRTPLSLFNPLSKHPFLFSPGDEVSIKNIDMKEFNTITHNLSS